MESNLKELKEQYEIKKAKADSEEELIKIENDYKQMKAMLELSNKMQKEFEEDMKNFDKTLNTINKEYKKLEKEMKKNDKKLSKLKSVEEIKQEYKNSTNEYEKSINEIDEQIENIDNKLELLKSNQDYDFEIKGIFSNSVEGYFHYIKQNGKVDYSCSEGIDFLFNYALEKEETIGPVGQYMERNINNPLAVLFIIKTEVCDKIIEVKGELPVADEVPPEAIC